MVRHFNLRWIPPCFFVADNSLLDVDLIFLVWDALGPGDLFKIVFVSDHYHVGLLGLESLVLNLNRPLTLLILNVDD